MANDTLSEAKKIVCPKSAFAATANPFFGEINRLKTLFFRRWHILFNKKVSIFAKL
jgi:hypothetical protein